MTTRREFLRAAAAIPFTGSAAIAHDSQGDRSGDATEWNYHPAIDAIAAKTGGVLIYDEQIVGALFRLGGLRPAEGYDLIRAIRSRHHAIVGHYRRRFRATAHADARQAGIEPPDADAIFNSLARASRYTFPKASAAVDARLG